MTFKYSHALTDLFGAHDSKNSKYYDFSVSYPVMESLSLDGHFGHQTIEGSGNLSYNDYKVGATLNYEGFDVGLHYVNTNLKDKSALNADGRLILSVGKSF